jgi:acid phosphatase type 7
VRRIVLLCATLMILLAVVVASLTVPKETIAEGSAEPVMIGAGDIAGCQATVTEDTATGDLVDAQVALRPDAHVFTVGDNAYPKGRLSDFSRCYDPAWGAAGGSFLGRTYPSLGNHEYADATTSSASGYFDYFGGKAAMIGSKGEGYYAYDVGPNWRAIVLNSNPRTSSDLAPGCRNTEASGLAQINFLKTQLANAGTKNVVAYFHHARFSDGPHGSTKGCAKKFFDLLYKNKADVVLVGHNHIYERLTDIDSLGNPVANGIDEFVVGEGGYSHDTFAVEPGKTPPPPGSVDARDNTRSGVLKLTLGADSYDWEYVGVLGESTFTDSGSEPVFR